MKHFFISYAHDDNDFAELLRIRLEEAEIKVWIDNSNIKAGTNWRESIDNAIRGSIGIILIMSPASLNSQYVTYEWAYALGLDKHLIPLMYRTTVLHSKLSTIQYLDFTHRVLRPWDELIKRAKVLSGTALMG